MKPPDTGPVLGRARAEDAIRRAGRFLYEEVVAGFDAGRDDGICGPAVRHARLRLLGLLDGAGVEPGAASGMSHAFAAVAMQVLLEDWDELRTLVEDAREPDRDR